jgi:hypothetical protein
MRTRVRSLRKKQLIPKTLPAPGQIVRVEGIPFEFPGVNVEGNDPIDVGQSLFRQANAAGYLPSGPTENGRWLGASRRDLARSQVRIPNGYYDALHLVAARDGDDHSVPLLSAMFYRDGAGYAETFETRVPEAFGVPPSGGIRAGPTKAGTPNLKPRPVTLTNGKKVNLWLVRIPLDPSRLTAFADMDIIEIEFTKKVHQYRSYPDPISYGRHQGGLPSGGRIYAATLRQSPVAFAWNPDRFGHVWTAPEVAAYTGAITNRSKAALTGKLTVTTRSFDGTETTKQEQPVTVAAGGTAQARFSLAVKLNGYHNVVATLELGDQTWTEQRSFVRLAPDPRSVKWTEGKGAMFGYWSYHGGHHTPKTDHHVRLMAIAGARQSAPNPHGLSDEIKALTLKHWAVGQSTAYYVAPQPWAAEPNYDPSKLVELRTNILNAAASWEKIDPDPLKPDCISLFAEPHITPRLTAGSFPEYWNGESFVYTEDEKQRLKMYFESARLAVSAVRVTGSSRLGQFPQTRHDLVAQRFRRHHRGPAVEPRRDHRRATQPHPLHQRRAAGRLRHGRVRQAVRRVCHARGRHPRRRSREQAPQAGATGITEPSESDRRPPARRCRRTYDACETHRARALLRRHADARSFHRSVGRESVSSLGECSRRRSRRGGQGSRRNCERPTRHRSAPEDQALLLDHLRRREWQALETIAASRGDHRGSLQREMTRADGGFRRILWLLALRQAEA